jgi:hypothetical protein
MMLEDPALNTPNPRRSVRIQLSGKVISSAVLAWLIPGAGHWYIGQRGKAIVFFCAISLCFWTGAIIGGAYSTVNFHENTAWFFAQIFDGASAILLNFIGRLPGAMPAYGKVLDLATIYTGVAGLLNVLVILDVLDKTALIETGKNQAGS